MSRAKKDANDLKQSKTFRFRPAILEALSEHIPPREQGRYVEDLIIKNLRLKGLKQNGIKPIEK